MIKENKRTSKYKLTGLVKSMIDAVEKKDKEFFNELFGEFEKLISQETMTRYSKYSNCIQSGQIALGIINLPDLKKSYSRGLNDMKGRYQKILNNL